MKPIIISIAILGMGVGLSACATVSEDTCRAGSWESLGFKDGRNGKSRSRLADIAESCAKYGIAPDQTAYLSGYDKGLPLYCTFDRGYERGLSGSGPKAECEAIGAVAYLDGVTEGAIEYEFNQEYEGLLAGYDDAIEALLDVETRLAGDELEPETRKRLRRKRLRLENRVEDARIDIRAFERIHGLPKYDFG